MTIVVRGLVVAALIAAGLGTAVAEHVDHPAIWSGFYVGADAGGVHTHVVRTATALNVSTDADRWDIGGHIGYSRQFDQFVIGLEGDLDHRATGTGTGLLPSVRARFGYATGPMLFYGIVGAAFTNSRITFTNVTTGATAETRVHHSGLALGGGAEWKAWKNIGLRGEVTYIAFDKQTVTSPLSGSVYERQPEALFYRLGVSYYFN